MSSPHPYNAPVAPKSIFCLQFTKCRWFLPVFFPPLFIFGFPPRNLALVSVPKFCYQLAKADAMLVGLAPLECSSPMRQQWPREAIIHRWLTVVTLLPGWVWSMAAVMSRRHRNTPSSVLYHHHLHRPTANTTIVLSSLWFWTQDCWWLHPGP